MHSLPPELQLYIMECCSRSDDGSTIRTLGCVSRTYRAMALSKMYEVICIDDDGRSGALTKLVEVLDLTALKLRRIVHLAIHIFAPFDDQMSEDFASLLRCAAPTVETLFITVPQINYGLGKLPSIRQLLCTKYKRLHSLTLTGHFMELNTLQTDPPTGTDFFPLLARLHLINPFQLGSIYTLPITLPDPLFSSVRCLRLSAAESELARRLRDVVTLWPLDAAQKLPHNLSYLLLSSDSEQGARIYEAEKHSQYQVYVSRTRSDDLSWENAKEMWIDGVQGGIGWWNVDELVPQHG